MPGSDPSLGRRPRGRGGNLGRPSVPAQPVNFSVFADRLVKLIGALAGGKAHAEITVQIQDGTIKYVRVNRGFLPQDMPEL